MVDDTLFNTYLNEAKKPFSGWDFSYVTESGRIQSQLLPWSYGSLVLPHVRSANTLLDMGTGGGEFLATLQPFPASVYATEGYEPNVSVARKRLEPLGVQVVYIEDDASLPLPDRYFDVILNRHESYSVQEIGRILNDEGVFITQQVGGSDCREINEMLGAPMNEEFAHWNLETALAELQDYGLRILDQREFDPVQRFYDIGALIYYLTAIPWQVQDFALERYEERLHDIHRLIQSEGYFEVRQQRFIIKATL